jgi:hypothetical protein
MILKLKGQQLMQERQERQIEGKERDTKKMEGRERNAENVDEGFLKTSFFYVWNCAS